MVDIDAIEEQHYEAFRDLCECDYDFDNQIFAVFADSVEQFRKWKMDDHDQENVYNRAFEELYTHDADMFSDDMKTALKYFIAHKETVAEFYKEWKESKK